MTPYMFGDGMLTNTFGEQFLEHFFLCCLTLKLYPTFKKKDFSSIKDVQKST